jgi:glycosyltransferase involved in cell wall biosynthesis
MSDAPLVSIVVPAYQSASYLRLCLTTIAQQTYSNWQAIVVDDASPGDPFVELRREFPSPRFRWIRHPDNRGPGPSRNSGVEHSEGELIFLVDSDDELQPTCVERLAAALRETPAADCAFCDFEFFGAEAKIHRFQYGGPGSLARSQCCPSQTMIRRTAWLEVGGQVTNPRGLTGNEDWDFWLRLAKRGTNLVQLSEPLYRYRVRTGSVTPIRKCQDARHRRRLFRAHGDFISRYVPKAMFVGEGHWIAAHAWNGRRHSLRALGHALCAWWLTHNHRRFVATCKAIVAVRIGH